MTVALARGVTAGSTKPVANIGYWRRSLRKLKRNRLALVMIALLVAEGLLAILAPALAKYGPDEQDLRSLLLAPNADHWLGTDDLGRDIFARVAFGARVSLGIAFLTVLIAATVGMAIGLVAGFYGGIVDTVTMRIVDILLAIPPIFFYILLSILFRPSVVGLAVVIASLNWMGVGRLVRGEALSTRHLDFVVAARSIGASNRRLMFVHILPATFPVVLVAASLSIAQVILIESALSFLGLGVQIPTPSWGNMISAAQPYFARAPHFAVFPGIAIFITVLGTNIIGNAVRDALDPRLD